jgi:ATP-dependent helicase HepA
MLATFDRRRATSREDIRFISADHSLVQDAIDLLVDSQAGTTAFGFITANKPNLLLEAIFLLETVAESRWHVDQFLAPTPVRVVIDLRCRDLTGDRDACALAGECEDGNIHRFLERPEFTPALLNQLIETATRAAEGRAETVRKAAAQKAEDVLTADLKRLVDLRVVNDHVRLAEIELAQEQIDRTRTAISQARLRLDSLRLVLEGPGERGGRD